MSDYNKPVVSFDRMTAVRVRDGLRLKAEFLPADKPDAHAGRCDGCPVPQCGGGRGGCNIAVPVDFNNFVTELHRRCMRCERKDGRNIIWRAATCPT